MTDIYNETYQKTIYDDAHTDEYAQDDEFYGEEFAEDEHFVVVTKTGQQRVIRLVLVIFVVLLIVGVLIFGVIPYVSAMTQTPLPLPPAVQA